MKYADDSKLGVVMKRKEDSHISFLRGRKELDLANQQMKWCDMGSKVTFKEVRLSIWQFGLEKQNLRGLDCYLSGR